MGLGAVAVLAVMFLGWYEPVLGDGSPPGFNAMRDDSVSAWEAFAVNDLILALAAVMALTAFALTAVQPTAAMPLALSSLTTLVSLVALVLVIIRVMWPPDLGDQDVFETARLTGAWLGLVASALLTAGCLASIRDERLPRPEHPVEPRLVKP